ncbi:MAG TPA: sigma-70 family RNA polymerase sigma factor, partial [Polyangia bacterium]
MITDAAERDDVVQQVWIETLRKGRRARALRPWLFGVMRNLARTELRRDTSRRAREEAAKPATATPQPDELVERVELEREVASALLEIAEPYRSTLLLRYYEDLAPTEIARRLKIPPGTVRWRLKQGLELLRANLDARFKGDRRRWALALVPTAAAARGGLGNVAIATIGGLLIMKLSTKVAAAVAVLLLLVAGGVTLFRHAATTNEVSRAHPGVAWRVPGGIGATTNAPPTVAGVAVPSWFGQRGAPLRRIAGRVTFAGAPVSNATVELQSDLTDAGLLRPSKRRTGGDGLFDFGTQPPAKFSVAATADGRSPAIIEIDTRDPTSAAERLELRLGGCESQLFGHVSDSSGGPIADAQVCLAPPRASACGATDPSGAYKICLAPHQNLVAVAATGYGAVYDRFDYTGRRVQRDYKLAPEGTIVGRVIRADTNAPVAHASVRSSSAESGLRIASPGATTTNEAGRFTISGLAGGRHRILAFAEGVASAEPVEVNVEPGQSSGEVLLRLVPSSRLSGVVTDGRDPIVGATVSLGFGASRESLDAVTQPDGSFVIDPVARGVGMLTVRDYDVREPKTIKIDRADVSGVRVLVDTMASVAGHVTFQGKPLAGALVSDAPQIYKAYAEPDGSYVVHGLPAGRYHMQATDPSTFAYGDGPDLVLTKGEKRTGVDIDVNRTAKISGIVVEPDGTPVSGVSVSFEMLQFADWGQDITSPDGTFCARYLRGGGDYRASVLAAAQTTVHLKLAGDSAPIVNVKDGTAEVTGVRLVVQRDHLSISGRTVDGDGQPFSDVRVVAFRADDMTGSMLDDHFAHPSAISAADSSWSIADLDSATYTLRARAGDGSEGILRGVAAGQNNVVITLQAAGAINGTLVGFSSPPAVRAVRQVG